MDQNRLLEIIVLLAQSRQRATYSAIAPLVGGAVRNLMTQQERNCHTSFVVSKKRGLPTGFEDHQLSPHLLQNEQVITCSHELAAWLAH